MKLAALETATFKLDGGAMFGVVPKVLWNKAYPSDEKNLCTFSLRCLLAITGNRRILVDCGIGNKQSGKFLDNYHISNYKTFPELLVRHNLVTDDITDVILTHLHFDHCGGAVKYKNNEYEPEFSNAIYWVGKKQWDVATLPNHREKASFLKENFIPLYEAGKVKFIEDNIRLYDDIEIRVYNGHTQGQIIPFFNCSGKTLVYTADVIPTSTHIPVAWIMSYDINPLVSLEDKEKLLNEAADNNYTLFFEHDFYTECCSLEKTEKGIRALEKFSLKDWLTKFSL